MTTRYFLLGDGLRDNGAESTTPSPGVSVEPLAEETGQLILEVAA